LAEGIADLHRRAREYGRDPASIEISFFWPRPELDALKRLRDLGLRRAVIAVPATDDMDKLAARLDRYAELARAIA
ncbi:MAG TPA: hypothetical protein VMF89_18660, partial [Polyangiales bacterium]|nr:hypothetical protein [Polyangiales bacterium]